MLSSQCALPRGLMSFYFAKKIYQTKYPHNIIVKYSTTRHLKMLQVKVSVTSGNCINYRIPIVL